MKADVCANFEELTTVDLLVSLQEVFLNEAHVTLSAAERPLTCKGNKSVKHWQQYNMMVF